MRIYPIYALVFKNESIKTFLFCIFKYIVCTIALGGKDAAVVREVQDVPPEQQRAFATFRPGKVEYRLHKSI